MCVLAGRRRGERARHTDRNGERGRHACTRARPKWVERRLFAQTRSSLSAFFDRAADAELFAGQGRAHARADGGNLRRLTLAKREVNASDMSSRCSVHRPDHPSAAPRRGIASSAHTRSAAALACASRKIPQTGIKGPHEACRARACGHAHRSLSRSGALPWPMGKKKSRHEPMVFTSPRT